MNTRKYDKNPIARKRAGKRQTIRQLVIQRALLEDRLKTVSRSLDNYEKSLPRSHITSDQTPRDSNNLAEISSVTELSNKFDELIRFAENHLEVDSGKPSHSHESKTIWIRKEESKLRKQSNSVEPEPIAPRGGERA